MILVTAINVMLSASCVPVSPGNGAYACLESGQPGQCLVSNGSTQPSWQACGGGSGAPTDGEYVTFSSNATLSAERVLTAGTNTAVDTSVAGQVKVNVSGLEPSGAYGGIGACGANTWASTLNDGAAPTCTQPGFSNLSGAASITQGGTTEMASTEDAVLVGASTTDWAPKVLPSCSNATTSKLLYDSSANTFSCGTDQAGAGGGLECSSQTVWRPVAENVGVTAPTFSTRPCQGVANMTALGAKGQPSVFDMDRLTHCKAVFQAGNITAQSGTLTVQLWDYDADTQIGSNLAFNNVACADRVVATTDVTAKTGLVSIGIRIGTSVVTDDPQFTPITVVCCSGSF